MPYKVNWYVENRVLRVRAIGDFSEQEFMESSQEVQVLIHQCASPVIFLLDFSELAKIAFTISALKMLNQFRAEARSVEWLIVVSSNVVYSFFGTLGGKVISLPVVVFKTQEEADSFIARQAPDIILPKASLELPAKG